MGADLAAHHVAHDDPFGLAIDQDQIKHLGACMDFDLPFGDLPAHRLIGTDEDLLTGLTAGIESTRDLRTAKRAVRQEPAIFAGKGDTLGDALIDNRVADFGQTVDVGFAGAVIAALDGVIEKTLDAVAIIGIVLGGVDTALGRYAVGTA